MCIKWSGRVLERPVKTLAKLEVRPTEGSVPAQVEAAEAAAGRRYAAVATHRPDLNWKHAVPVELPFLNVVTYCYDMVAVCAVTPASPDSAMRPLYAAHKCILKAP